MCGQSSTDQESQMVKSDDTRMMKSDDTRQTAEEVKSARAKRNRDAATRSRQQIKEKKNRLEGENKVLADRIVELEREHEELQRQFIAKYGRRKDFD